MHAFLAPRPCCHACGHPTAGADLDEVTPEVAAHLDVSRDARVCRWCAAQADRELDEMALEEALADAPEADRDAREAGTLCEECGRHMADARGPLCSCCTASWFTPGVTVPRADHEGPRPVVFDCAATVAA